MNATSTESPGGKGMQKISKSGDGDEVEEELGERENGEWR